MVDKTFLIIVVIHTNRPSAFFVNSSSNFKLASQERTLFFLQFSSVHGVQKSAYHSDYFLCEC